MVSGCVGFGPSAVTVVWDCWWDCTVLWDGGSEVPAVDVVVAVVVVAVELLLLRMFKLAIDEMLGWGSRKMLLKCSESE